MRCEPGLTAFFSNVQAYELMTDEERMIADRCWVEHAPHPYMRMGDRRGPTTGPGAATKDHEKNIGDLGEYDPKHIKRYPIVWMNPVTGEKAFMVHGICARKLSLRSSPDEEPVVVEDVGEIRAFLKTIQERVLKPEYIMLPKVEEGDIIMWANWQTFHSAVDYPESWGPRTMHQANIRASTAPVGPVPIPLAA